MLRFARLMRCAIVASGTRNAWAISAVVSPPTARSVSAIADDVRQRRMAAHEEQHERVVLLRIHPDSGGRARAPAAAVSRCRRDDFAAQVVGHAPRGDLDQPPARIFGNAFARPLQRRRQQRLLHRVLRGAEIAEAADHRAEHLRREFAQQVLGWCVQRHSTSSGGPLITWRTSIGMFIGAPSGPGAADARAAIAYACSGLLDVDNPVARQKLLGLRKYAVGDRRAVLAGAHDLRLLRAGEPLRRHQFARFLERFGRSRS